MMLKGKKRCEHGVVREICFSFMIERWERGEEGKDAFAQYMEVTASLDAMEMNLFRNYVT